jgi:uncharacterized membrane protein
MSRIRRAAPLAMGGVFTASGLLHFVRPQSFETIMPRAVPARHHRGLVYASGLAELVCALGLFRRANWAPAAATAVLAGVFPANVQMALDAGSGRHPGAADHAAVAWGRLPLQALMIWAVRQTPVSPGPTAGS